MMMIQKLNLVFLLLSLAHGQEPAPSLRGSAVDVISNDDTPSLLDDIDIVEPYLLDRQGRRHLQAGGMQPLSCNDNYSPCVPWSRFVGTQERHTSLVVIPCGQCVTMDHAGDRLILNGGLDIQGKLVFPNAYRGLTLYAAMIVVQGELDMRYGGRITGTPSIKFIMVGNGSRSYEPVGENANYCGGRTCVAGKKAITVAGGKVFIRGIPGGAKTWVKLYDVLGTSQTETSGLVVPAAGVQNRWGVGAEILVTAYNNQGDENQVRRITGIDSNYPVAGYLRIFLDEPIERPTTVLDDDRGFAVEVALLSRHIVFEGGSDNTAFHGGHFWFFETPDQVQRLSGVEFVNFGQAGELGRYPIHAHLCGDMSGSIIAQNTIRDSFQRCVVIHASDNILVEENVAFNNGGHCYMLEDGVEFGNRFEGNLGAQTKKPGRIIPGRGETDDQPATFWVPALGNSWINNVAAGCVEEDSNCSGFWFEPLLRGPLANNYPGLRPAEVNIVAFEGNSAHSNAIGMKTYPDAGLRPSVGSPNTFVDFLAYRNRFKGLFIFFASNLIVQGGIFADNAVNLDIDQSLSVQVFDAEIIGESEVYAAQMEAQRFFQPCNDDMLIGLQLNLDGGRTGVEIDPSVTFSRFGSSRCGQEIRVRLDNDEISLRELRDLTGGGGGGGPAHALGDLPDNLYINAGGTSVIPGNIEWDVDKYFLNGRAITVREDDRIVSFYREQVVAPLRYRIPVNDGLYTVTLFWSETEYTTRNARRFNVFGNGELKLGNFDVFAAAGRANALIRRDITVLVENDEELNLTFEGTVRNAFLTAYIVRPNRD